MAISGVLEDAKPVLRIAIADKPLRKGMHLFVSVQLGFE